MSEAEILFGQFFGYLALACLMGWVSLKLATARAPDWVRRLLGRDRMSETWMREHGAPRWRRQ